MITVDTQFANFAKALDEYNGKFDQLQFDITRSNNWDSGVVTEYYVGDTRDYELTYFQKEIQSIKIVVKGQVTAVFHR